MSEIVVFWEENTLERREDVIKVRAHTERLELKEVNQGETASVFRQGPPGVGLEFDWRGKRLGVGRTGEGLVYRDLGRAYGAGGWALWRDLDLSEAAPLLVDGSHRLELSPTFTSNFAPDDAEAWYDGVHFFPQFAGESYLLRLSFTALPLVAERELAVRLEVEDFFVLWGDQTELSRGAGVPQRVSFEPFVYALATFVREGAVFRLGTDGPLELYDFSLLAVRLVER